MHKGGELKWAWQGHSHSNRLCCFFPERGTVVVGFKHAGTKWLTNYYYYRHCQGSCFWGWILLIPLDASVKFRVCEELHAASASRMSLRWLVFSQASEAFSSSSRALRLAVPHLFHCWKSVTCCTLRIRDAALSCIVPYLWPSLIYRST